MSQAVNIGNTMKAVQPTATAARADGCRFIAADVGGTNARIALVHADTDGRVEILDYRRYPCATYPGLTAILAEGYERVAEALIKAAQLSDQR